MAKLQDKLYNRIIDGKLEVEESDDLGEFGKELRDKAYKIEIPVLQATATVVVNPLTNINGRELSAYESNYVDDGAYPYYLITKNSQNLTIAQAEEYMEYMTGSKYLPLFNYEKPKNSLWIMANGTFLKPQFDEQHGIRLFVLPNPFSPFSATHSFNELDAQLKLIIETAISSGEDQPCTFPQWSAIKALLDKSLYINYNGNSMIKSFTNGIDYYIFGGIYVNGGLIDGGSTLCIVYDDVESILSVSFSEI